MPDWKRRLLGMGLPCLLAFLFDVGMTLHGQPAEYWAGDYSQTTEGAPFIRKAYLLHPAAVFGVEALWVGIIVTWVLLLPEVLAVIVSIAVVFGHTVGGYTWLGILPMAGWFQTAHGAFLVSAAVLGVALNWSLRKAHQPDSDLARRGLHPFVRWALISAASALACYMYLIPQ